MPTHLQAGQKAPLFEAIDANGATISLRELRGKRVVLFFYPEDDTPTCTVEACNLRDNYSALKAAGYTVIGVSPNDSASHARFQQKFKLPFSLLPDTQHQLINKYGVWGEKNLYGKKYMGLHRTTFVINEDGVIEKIYLRPRSKVHAEEILGSAQKG